MTFLSPIALYALAAAALPLLLHLVRRRRVRIVRWGAWRFLLQSQQRLRRRLRLEQLLLALMRAGAVTLIVLGFARPILRAPASALRGDRAGVHAVIALDNSMSMAYARDGRSDFDRAKSAADAIIAQLLRSGDTVSVALVSSHPEVLVRQPSHDLDGARRQITKARLSDYGTDYRGAARLCAELATPSSAPRREVYILTDSQLGGFAPESAGDAPAAWRALTKAAHVTWVNVAEGPRPNASLTDAALSKGYVTPASPVRVEAQIQNRTGKALQSAAVRLDVDGRPAGSAVISVPENGSERVSFAYVFEETGTRTGRIFLDRPDGLDRDNASWFAIRVRPAMHVLVVGPEGAAGEPAESLFVAAALAPTGAVEGAGSGIVVTVQPNLPSAGASLTEYGCVILVGGGGLTTAQLRSLRSYVGNGGGVLAFPAPNSADLLTALSNAFADGRVGVGSRRTTSLERPFTIDTSSVTHAALALFRGSESSDLARSRFTARFPLTIEPAKPRHPTATAGADDTEALTEVSAAMRFQDGTAAIAEMSVGDGRVVLCGFPLAPSASDLVLRPAFVPLIHQLAAHLASGRVDGRMVEVGKALRLRYPLSYARTRISVRDPSDHTVAAATSVRGETLLLTCPIAAQAGVHRIVTGIGGSTDADAYAANAVTRESDLTEASPEAIRRLTGGAPLQHVRRVDELLGRVRESRHGTDISASLLVTALALLTLEPLAARLIGRRR